jgi:hypothetical protein
MFKNTQKYPKIPKNTQFIFILKIRVIYFILTKGASGVEIKPVYE